MNNYFDFIMYLAFEVVLGYENKRSITVEQLHNYHKEMCKQHIEYYSRFTEYDDKEFEKKLKTFHKLNMNMSEEEEIKNFESFIINNSDFFDIALVES